MVALYALMFLVVGSFDTEGASVAEPQYPTVCHEPWGCFSLAPPFTNTGYLPQSPRGLGVRFFLYTREKGEQELYLDWSDERFREAVDVSKATRVIVHGYLDGAHRPWVQNMTSELLRKADQNVLVLDWAQGAASINYFQVAANTRLVARMLAAILRRFMQIGAQPTHFHLIGMSLGAHISGYVGSELPGIGRITGLDPAGPAFEATPPEVRLDPSDAIFVDVIHTNALPIVEMGLGYEKPCGTVDFYPNGGRHQPGCHNSLFSRLLGLLRGSHVIKVMGCSHLRSIYLFSASINTPCPLLSSPSSFPAVLNQDRRDVTLPCQDCVTMGYDVSLNASGVFYARTGSTTPFCPEEL